MKNNRRRSTRFPLELPASVHWEEGTDTRTVQTRTKDISSSGLYLMLEKEHRPNSRIQFEVRLPDSFGAGSGAVLCGKGRLIRQESLSGRQIGFAAVIERCEIRPAQPRPAVVTHRTRAAPQAV
ncbi:MAG: PilZ domain-containing protein [Acidobacteria bacterium]|nr:PilZ domain-containing protein [Acidobacteriota bacterium]